MGGMVNIRRIFLAAIVFALSLPAEAFAQKSPPPDITGTWVLNIAKSKLPKGADIHSEKIVITVSGSDVVMKFTIDGEQSTHMYVANGKERVFAELKGSEVVDKAYWKKSAFITEESVRMKTPDLPDINNYEVLHFKEWWKLSADGRLLTQESEGSTGRTVSVYDKQ